MERRISRRASDSRAELTRDRRYWLALAVVLSAVMGFHLFSLLRTPPPFVDEAWRASRAWSLIHTGRPFGTLEAGVFDRYDGYWTFFPWLETWFLALSIRALGLSLFAVRLVSLAFGLVLLIAVGAIAKSLGGRRLGLVAVLLVALSNAFLLSAHVGRQDVIVAAFGFTAIALHVTDRARTLSLQSLLSGLIAGLAFEIHPNGMIYAVPIVALYLLDLGWAVVRSRRFWGFVAGVALGLACYVALHILPYPQTYAALTRLGYSATHTPPLLIADPRVWAESLGYVLLLLVLTCDLRMALVVVGAVALLRTRTAANRKLLVLLGALILAFTALIRSKPDYYAILISPAADLVAAALLVELWRRGMEAWQAGPRSRLVFGVLSVLVGGLLVAGGVRGMASALNNPMDDYRTAVERVRQAIPADRSVMASQTYWFGMPDQRYLSWDQLVYYQRYAPGSTLEDALREFHPDYFILDSFMERFIVEDPDRLASYYRSLSLPKADLDRFLGRQAQLVSEFRSQTFGRVRIYRIGW